MIELVLARAPYAALFFPREELPSTECALTPLLERASLDCRLRRRDGADRQRAARGLRRQHQRVVGRSPGAPGTPRGPWHADNAITRAALGIAALAPAPILAGHLRRA